MLPDEIVLEKDDLSNCGWQDVISQSQKKNCHDYVSLLSRKAKDVEEQGNAKCQAILELLSHACSLQLKPDSTSEPFGPMIVMYDRRTAIIDDFNESHLNVLEEIVGITNDAELRARIADILWFRRKGGYKMAELAIKSYIESANSLEDSSRWSDGFYRIERAAHLAASLGKSNQAYKDVIEYIENVLDRYNAEDPMFLTASLMKLLQGYGEGEPTKYAVMAEKAALNAEASDDESIKWHRARTYWEIKANWHRKNNDAESVKTSLSNAAETYVKEAEDALKRPDNPHSLAASFLQQAIEAYRRIEGTQGRRDEIHKELLKQQRESVVEFQAFSHTQDISHIVEETRNQVKGKSILDAIFALVLAGSSPRMTDLQKEIEERLKTFSFSLWIPAEVLDKDGKIVARRPGMYGTEDENKNALRAEMLKRAKLQQELIARAIVLPAISQIDLEHNVQVTDLLQLVNNSLSIR